MPELEEKIKQACFPILSRLATRLPGSKLEEAGKMIAEGLAEFFQAEKAENQVTELLRTCKLLDQAGFFPGKSGNISIRRTPETFLITPTGVRKTELTSPDLVEMSMNGHIISGKRKPSSEVKMHCHIYQKRPDVKAVVHAHPPFATGFAAAGLPLDVPVLPEAILVLGKIALAEYGTPGTWELPHSLTPYLERGDNTFLLSNHGALTLGDSLGRASHRMETLELFANVLLISRLLGGEKILSSSELEKLALTHSNPVKG